MATPIKGFDWIANIAAGSGDWLMYGGIILFFVVVSVFIYMQLKSRGKSYKTTIWEYAGNSVRKVTDTLMEKEDKDKTVMFKLKRAKIRVPVTLNDATVTSGGRVTFDLIKVEDNYYPMRPTQNVQIYEVDDKGDIVKDEEGNPTKREMKLIEFGAEFKLRDIKAAAHKIGQDSKIYTFWEKNAALMQFVATMMQFTIPFVLMLIVVWKIGPLLKGMSTVSIAITGLVDKFAAIANSLEIIAQHLGGVVPPLG